MVKFLVFTKTLYLQEIPLSTFLVRVSLNKTTFFKFNTLPVHNPSVLSAPSSSFFCHSQIIHLAAKCQGSKMKNG